MPRRLGLSWNQPVPSLLKTVGNKPRIADSVEAPPLSTDEEDASQDDADGTEERARSPKLIGLKSRANKVSPGSPRRYSDSSGDERNTKLPIKPTNFKSSKGTEQSNASTRTRRTRQEAPGAKRRKLESKSSNDVEDDEAWDGNSVSSKLSSSQPDHLKTEAGFVKRQKTAATYKQRDKAQNKRITGGSGTKSKLHVPDDIESPEKAKSKLLLPESLPDSPSKDLPARFKSLDQDKDVADPLSSPLSSRHPESSAPKVLKKKPSVFIKKRAGKRKAEKPISRSPSRSPSPQAVFLMPDDLPEAGMRELDHGNDNGDFQLTEDDSDLDSIVGLKSPKEKKESVKALPSCPWCGEPVEESLLRDFSKGVRLNVRMQTKFCQKHRRQTALKTWESKQYPEIVWEELEDRLAKHREFLLGIVNGKSSHFRTKLADDIEAGKARSMKKEGNLNPGYYGPRGFNIMSDYLVEEFSDLLKQRAVDDRVIAGRGSAAFIQAVLVAELGVRLISEDMGVDTVEARNIMEESKALGDMVHEEV